MYQRVSQSDQQRWLFVHDHRFVKTDDFIGSESQFESSLWTRYLEHCESLTVLGREAQQNNGIKLHKSSRENVDFVLTRDDGRGVRRLIGNGSRNVIKEQVELHHAVVARLPSTLGLQAVKEARRQNVPYAVEVVGCPWDALWNYGSLRGRLYAPLLWYSMRRAVARAEHVIYVTQQFLQRRYPAAGHSAKVSSDVRSAVTEEKSFPRPDSSEQQESGFPDMDQRASGLLSRNNHVAHVATASNVELPANPKPGENHDKLDPAFLVKRMEKIHRLGEGPLKIGLIGTLNHHYKGLQFAMPALACIRGQLPPVSFHVLGAGRQDHWTLLARKHGVDDIVIFDGTLPGGEPVFQWLDNIDLYIQPSLQEGLPRALIEAMSRGCPAIGSDCAGIPELLAPEAIVRKGAIKPLAAAMLAMLSSKQAMRVAAEQNFAKAQSYTAPRLQARRTAFFQEVHAAAAKKVTG